MVMVSRRILIDRAGLQRIGEALVHEAVANDRTSSSQGSLELGERLGVLERAVALQVLFADEAAAEVAPVALGDVENEPPVFLAMLQNLFELGAELVQRSAVVIYGFVIRPELFT